MRRQGLDPQRINANQCLPTTADNKIAVATSNQGGHLRNTATPKSAHTEEAFAHDAKQVHVEKSIGKIAAHQRSQHPVQALPGSSSSSDESESSAHESSTQSSDDSSEHNDSDTSAEASESDLSSGKDKLRAQEQPCIRKTPGTQNQGIQPSARRRNTASRFADASSPKHGRAQQGENTDAQQSSRAAKPQAVQATVPADSTHGATDVPAATAKKVANGCGISKHRLAAIETLPELVNSATSKACILHIPGPCTTILLR